MRLNELEKNIPLFAKSQDTIWTDPYISQRMLEAHLKETEEGATRNVAFVQRSVEWFAAKFPPAEYPNLLDLGCGPGIYAERFYEKGYSVTGIDFSEVSIAYAKKSAAQKQHAITYLAADYLSTSLQENTYDLIVLIYCDLGVLSHTERRQLLTAAYRALRPGGKLVFDVFTPVRYADFRAFRSWQVEQNSFWSETACLRLQENCSYPQENTYLERHDLLYQNSHKTFFIWETVFEPETLEKELSQTGYQSIERFSSIAGDNWQDQSEVACFSASKQ
ncbi:SAM-dependent methyltransferase [Enterococcus florum]|uniref:SAM-dependent methyltransferase n=1 Tax=Enterococcus florum TaxID=2480627 RepID=A0A4P5PR15_9ENTE|nr:class I SAM-dependent methyltransferase [Enterococcus florum]GCF95333.1 SAM-dependent methyltransferase [Enterococcus florum]